MKTLRQNVLLLAGLLLAVSLLVAACSPAPPAEQPVEPDAEHQVQLPAVGAGEDEIEQPAEDAYPAPALAPTAIDDSGEAYPVPQVELLPTTNPYPEPEPTQAVLQPTPRAEMVASDIRNFELAAGQVQLVEFFAFW